MVTTLYPPPYGEGSAHPEDANYVGEINACSFCGWEDDDRWIKERRRDGYGLGPFRDNGGYLCQFCRNSYAVSAWAANGRYTTAEKDLMISMNVLRWVVLGRDLEGAYPRDRES